MKKKFLNAIVISFIYLCSCILYSQSNSQIKKYYIKTVNESVAPIFKENQETMLYAGKDEQERIFFSKYTIIDFKQVYPNSKRASLRNAFMLTTTSDDIATDLLKVFPEKYIAIESVVEQKVKLNTTPYTPPDFATSITRIPFNLNIYDRSELLYIDVPKAWGITEPLNKTITIGISDAKVDDQVADLQGKVTYINPYGSSVTPNCNNGYTTHGTGVSIIAAANGENSIGTNEITTTGVCYNCDIIATALLSYNNLLLLAQNGAKVINMSWGINTTTPPDQYTASCNVNQDQQECINEIVEDYGVVLVAASGNDNSFNSNGPLLQYDYPASYDNVISVTGVNHWYTLQNAPSYDPGNGDTYNFYVEDSVAELVNYDSTLPNPPPPAGVYSGFDNPNNIYMHTVNEAVDIAAPGYQITKFSIFTYDCDPHNIVGKYSSGTSLAAPIVTGTVGLMLSVNECLIPSEVESILKLTTKDIEVNPMNAFAAGYIGAGKLETGNAVEFVNEMQKSDGVATIKDHIFYRYNFDLEKFNHDLVIENVVFKDDVTVNFAANNSIQLKEGTHLVPNVNGSISIKADDTINDVCIPTTPRQSVNNDSFEDVTPVKNAGLIIYPNPTSNTTSIALKNTLDTITVFEVYTIDGNLVLRQDNNDSKDTIRLNMSNLRSGIYLIKTITKNNEVLTSKIIKK